MDVVKTYLRRARKSSVMAAMSGYGAAKIASRAQSRRWRSLFEPSAHGRSGGLRAFEASPETDWRCRCAHGFTGRSVWMPLCSETARRFNVNNNISARKWITRAV
ncbi:hypothetical protein KCP69_23800 [Salmonella enterica subsp. enterica]|nr:hypothetical protein KCP69_23800 [Salmonella enterica subsp. enterica]